MKLLKNLLFRIISKQQWLQHLVFWAFAWYLMLRLFANSSEVSSIDYIYTSIFIVTLALCVYTNLLIFIPWLLANKMYFLYAVSVIITILISAWINMFLFSDLIDYILPGYYFISYYDYFDLLKIFIAFVSVTTLLKLSKGWFQLIEARNNLTRLEKENAQAELATLKSQINPHFLFNSLNSLYSMTLTGSEKAPSYILKLSDLLRYLIYDTGKDLVSLEKELNSISDYIEIQLIRLTDHNAVNYHQKGDPSGKYIAPLLFMPLVENAFKHGVKSLNDESLMDIDIIIDDNYISFTIKNSVGKASQVENNESSGVGLSNLRKRLVLAYPNQHSFKIETIQEKFIINMQVPLHDEAQMSNSGG